MGLIYVALASFAISQHCTVVSDSVARYLKNTLFGATLKNGGKQKVSAPNNPSTTYCKFRKFATDSFGDNLNTHLFYYI